MWFGRKTASIVLIVFFWEVNGAKPQFRVLAPEFICPNDEDAIIEKPDNTIITVRTNTAELKFSWIVRWTPLEAPSQRFTLMLWRAVRALEAKLNGPHPEAFVYAINNTELLRGVKYAFNITGTERDTETGTTKTFYIDNIKGDQKLMIEGRSDKFSVLLIGGDTVYVDMQYMIEALVTTCVPTQDYYFVWSVQSSSASPVNVSETRGSELDIPPYSLQAGAAYYVTCKVYTNSRELITQTDLLFQVLYRGLKVHLSLDVLIVMRNKEFIVEAAVENHDYFGENPTFHWCCAYENGLCENIELGNNEVLAFPNGLASKGLYEITLMVSLHDQRATANASIEVVEHTLPVIQIQPQRRVVNEDTIVTLVANASNVTPSCILTWYFATKEYLASLDSESCEDCQGEALADSVTVFSLEENFLNELTDFTNETEWRQVTAEMHAAVGRARFVAHCGCSLTFSCETQGTVYADIVFELNESPKVAQVKASPETGYAMETEFRLSTLAASDPDRPLRYTFYCSLGSNDTLILRSNLEHFAVDTFLPYIGESGTQVWVESCDSLEACSTSKVVTIQLQPGEGRSVQAWVDNMQGHVARCEMTMLRYVVEAAIVTYKNAKQAEALYKFTKALLETLPSVEEDHCINNYQDYSKLLDWLLIAGVDIAVV